MMGEINERVLEVSKFVEDCYKAQTRAFSPWEYTFIRDLLLKNNLKRVLDVGTGNGTFIHGLAKLTPGMIYEATDADQVLIGHAKKNHTLENISYENRLFDHSYPGKDFDLITARFAVEHMHDVPHFISECHKRLNKDGFLLITEYYIDPMHSDSEPWRAFREREYELYLKFGSHPRISLALPKFMREAGFFQVDSIYRHISPSTIGAALFYELIISYANLYHNIEPAIFDEQFRTRILSYCKDAVNRHASDEDSLMVSHTTGRKSRG